MRTSIIDHCFRMECFTVCATCSNVHTCYRLIVCIDRISPSTQIVITSAFTEKLHTSFTLNQIPHRSHIPCIIRCNARQTGSIANHIKVFHHLVYITAHCNPILFVGICITSQLIQCFHIVEQHLCITHDRESFRLHHTFQLILYIMNVLLAGKTSVVIIFRMIGRRCSSTISIVSNCLLSLITFGSDVRKSAPVAMVKTYAGIETHFHLIKHLSSIGWKCIVRERL